MMKRVYSMGLGVGIALVLGMGPAWGEEVSFTLMQLNDVYEITPVSGGQAGGLARVATLLRDLERKDPHTWAVLAGDLLSPSALGTARVGEETLAGKQMVAVMNQVGLDLATFGNHEFDIPLTSFQDRLKESQFSWFSSNVFTAAGQPWPMVPPYVIRSLPTPSGGAIRVGFVGVTVPSNPATYITYGDPLDRLRTTVRDLKAQGVAVIVAVTHLPFALDQKVAETIPEIDLILGGHEHENMEAWRGTDWTPIFKADANARTVYIHHLRYDTDRQRLRVTSELQPITPAIPEDRRTADLVQRWQQLAFRAFAAQGFDPQAVVAHPPVALDGLESSVRNQSTDLTQAIAQGFLQAIPGADLAIFNGGSVRIDDVLPPGPLTQYDVIRILPFGGKVLKVRMGGALVAQVLDQGLANGGTGGFLHTAQVSRGDRGWLIQDQPLDRQKTYTVAISDYLMTGNEIGLSYLTRDNPQVKILGDGGDLRFALINYLKKTWP